MIDPSANFSGFPGGYSPFAAMMQAFQNMPQAAPVQMPQMTPQQFSYGPMHSALAQSLAQALQSQTSGGLLGSVTPQQMGLLSTSMTPATGVGLPTKGAGQSLDANQYYRLTPSFWNTMPNRLAGSKNKSKDKKDNETSSDNPYTFTKNDGSDQYQTNPGAPNWTTGETQVYGGGSDNYGLWG